MDWSQRMSQAIDYIEQHLADDIDIRQAAHLACCSTFHFQRMFMVITGNTIAEYIRHRRLTLAAQELSSGQARVIDVSLKYGYDSPDSFTRAFRNLHGITPQAARAPGVNLIAFPRISFQISLKGGKDVDYCLLEKPAFSIFGKTVQSTNDYQDNFQKLPRFWQELKQTQDYSRICTGVPGNITGGLVLGVCYMAAGSDDLYYMVGAEQNPDSQTQEMQVIRIPASTWAVFNCRGAMPEAIQKVIRQVFDEWFPSTGFEHADTPELEVYLAGDFASPDYRSQVWIPIKKSH